MKNNEIDFEKLEEKKMLNISNLTKQTKSFVQIFLLFLDLLHFIILFTLMTLLMNEFYFLKKKVLNIELTKSKHIKTDEKKNYNLNSISVNYKFYAN